ncbi:MAG: ribonuclease Z [Thermoproteus sp.]|jgi:ribonuclease Z|nr:ribonuclease Z [Thermoproteus sp.]MDT7882936.1 ribonuclease Z [Thermoproteus sp.]
MYLHVIGSGAGGSPGSRRWRAANLLEAEGGLAVVDCGVGCHYRLSDRGLLTEIDYVFVTHSHMDHFLGLPEALFQAHIEGRRKKLVVVAPKIVARSIEAVSPNLLKAVNYQIEIRQAAPGPLLELPGLKVEAAQACHHTAEEAYAYRLEGGGTSLLFTGDTSPNCGPVRRLGRGVDVLIHEATCNEQNAEICAKYAHTTTLQAVKEADAAGAHLLVLTHIDDGFNPTIYRDVKNIGRRDVVIAEDNMWLRI